MSDIPRIVYLDRGELSDPELDFTDPDTVEDPVAFVLKEDHDEAIEALRGAVEAMERGNVGSTVPGMNRLITARTVIAKAEEKAE